MTTDQTPDVVRAAIAEEIEYETGYDRIYCEKLAGKAYDRLVQIGALRVVGDGVSKAELREAVDRLEDAHSRLCDADKMFGSAIPDEVDRRRVRYFAERTEILALIDRLPIPDAALRPVGEGDQWCLPISTLRNWLDWAESVGPMCGYGLHTLIHREVIAADAAARAGDEPNDPSGGETP